MSALQSAPDSISRYGQIKIHAGARKFNLNHIQEVSQRVLNYVKDNDAEILDITKDGIKKGGCDPQLWTIAAKHYFKHLPKIVL